jgi:hypothetical protein
MKSWNHAVNTPERVEVPNKTTLAPSTKKEGGGGQKLLEKITLQKCDQERRNQKLLENPKMWFNQTLNNIIRMKMIHNLVLKRAI